MDLLHAYSKHYEGRPVGDLALNAQDSRRPSSDSRPAKTARQLRPAEIDQLVARYRDLGNVADVVREFGITRQTVGIHLASRGIETVRRMTADDIAVAAAKYRNGHSAAAIGRLLGFDAQTVLNGLRRVGVSIRPRSGYKRDLARRTSA